MISLQNVSKKFGGAVAVDDITLTVNTGDNLVLLGTSGCGKTTTLRMINRLIEPDSGNILINGKEINSGPEEELRRKIGYVLQHNALFPHYTVAENIAVVPRLLKWNEERISARIKELAGKLRFPLQFINKYPSQLSGGQQQRVNIARALAADPDVLLMDEPFGALDPITRNDIVTDFKQLDELKRKTIVLVTHDVNEAFDLGDRICLMDQGKIVQQGTPEELLFNPCNDFVRNFLSKYTLQLSLKHIRLHDLWEHFTTNKNDNTKKITSATTLWQGLGMLTDPEGIEEINVQNDNGDIKTVSLLSLMDAYRQYKMVKRQ
ncbi:MAG: ABC transporter ATP-binding protein [Taibaiella sp.]|nr:ABC transporter ATP-binding protein [Taibaiella sp.]